MTTKDEIMESVKRTGEAVDSEMFCLELATILCAPQYCGTIDVAKCITRPNKFILIKHLSTGNKLHICVDNGDVEVRVVDGHDNLMKSIVPECQTVLRNAIATYIQQVKVLKAKEEKEAMEAVSAEVAAEVAAIAGNPFQPSQEKPAAPACDEAPMMSPMAPIIGGIAAGGITIPSMPTEDRIGLAKVLLAAMESAMKADKEGKTKKPSKSKKGSKQGKTVAVIVKSTKDGKAKQPKKNK